MQPARPRNSGPWIVAFTDFAGDTSYAGIVLEGGVLWISYYSSHEGKTSVYLAKVKPGE